MTVVELTTTEIANEILDRLSASAEIRNTIKNIHINGDYVFSNSQSEEARNFHKLSMDELGEIQKQLHELFQKRRNEIVSKGKTTGKDVLDIFDEILKLEEDTELLWDMLDCEHAINHCGQYLNHWETGRDNAIIWYNKSRPNRVTMVDKVKKVLAGRTRQSDGVEQGVQ